MDNYLEVIYEILIDLDNIKDALERGISITNILSPPFDPFKTIGKYWTVNYVYLLFLQFLLCIDLHPLSPGTVESDHRPVH